jgi:hypothetical protein
MEPEPTRFQPPATYQFLFTLPALLSLAMLIELIRRPSAESAVMVMACVALSLVALPRGWASVELLDDQVTLHMPLRRPVAVHLRQLIDYEVAGRGWRTLLLRYHPMDDQGRLDIANQEFLSLVPLRDQYVLEERLEAVVGRSRGR